MALESLMSYTSTSDQALWTVVFRYVLQFYLIGLFILPKVFVFENYINICCVYGLYIHVVPLTKAPNFKRKGVDGNAQYDHVN
jgi:hypothetical protein